MKVNPSVHRAPARRRGQATPSKQMEGSSQDKDYVVLVYSANNVPSLGSNPEPVAGSFRLLPELKSLAQKTDKGSVAIVTQGYEQTESGEWETRRYRIDHGHCRDESEEIDGYRNVYSETSPPQFEKAIFDSGEQVSMFSQEAVEDFMRDALLDYPAAKNVVLFLNAHGAPTPNFGGEAIINGEYHPKVHEHISVKTFGDALENVMGETGRKLSLLDLNTCEMGKAANILELGQNADLMLASPQNEFVPKGHEYTAAFQDIVGACEALIADPKLTPRQLGETIITRTTEKTTFVERDRVENPIPTLDLYDMTELPDFSQELDRTGRRLSAMLKNPEQKSQVLNSLKEAFVFRKNVVDLEGFLKGIDDPATRALGESLEEMVLHSFAGKFRGRDYSEAGPMAFYMPAFREKDQTGPVLPEVGEDLNPLLDKLTAQGEIKSARRWIVGQSSKLSTFQSHLSLDYPSMLEVLPNPELEGALTSFQDMETVNRIQREMMDQITAGTPETLAPLREELRTTLGPLQERLKKLDIAGWIEQFEAMDGQTKMIENTHRKAFEREREQALKPVREYHGLDNLPPGWESFLEDVTEAVVEEGWGLK